MPASPSSNLQLDRSHANLLFSSWTLARDIVRGQAELGLGGSVATGDSEETDFVHARFAALHNHLLAGGRYLFLRGPEGLSLHRLQPAAVGAGGAAAPALATVAVLGEQADAAAPAAIEPALPPSVAEVLTTDPAQQPAGAGGALLVSRGLGDLVLLQRGPDGSAAAASAAVHPLRPPAPLQGVRTFFLEAAMQLPGSSSIRCVLWAVRQRTDTQPSRCEVFAVTLGVGAAGSAAPVLSVKAVQLLRRSTLTPHGALLDPAAGSILLAMEPAGDVAEAGIPNGSAPPPQLHAEPVDDSGDPVSPRTLQAAVARLEQFTSEEPAPGLPPNQWADLYSESGPDGVGDLGQEPACNLFAYDSSLACVEQVACLPHKVLTCHPSAGGLLLGLTDDVDCAVLELAPTGADADVEGAGASGGFSVRHTASIPALAYVVAGKLQRKFLLLARPGGPLAGALVESHRYAYIYRSVPAGEERGHHEVVELGLPEGSTGVLGAALVGGGGAAGGGYQLLLLSAQGLRAYELY